MKANCGNTMLGKQIAFNVVNMEIIENGSTCSKKIALCSYGLYPCRPTKGQQSVLHMQCGTDRPLGTLQLGGRILVLDFIWVGLILASIFKPTNDCQPP